MIQRIAERATGLFAVWTVLGTIWAWFVPAHFTWVTSGAIQPFGQPLVSVLLGVIMLGMGITLDLDDFRRVVAMPRAVLAGVVLQFTIMPMAGIALALGFGLETGLAVGLILVSCCPGGTASNVVTYLARANLALSVTMTMASTLVAIVLVPVVAGVLLNRYLPQATRRMTVFSPLVSVIVVVLIVGAIIASSKELIEAHFGTLLLAIFLLHVAGFALGYLIARLLGFRIAERRTISIEVGMQNSGLGASLASAPSFAAQFTLPMQAALAPVPSAISAVYHVVIGSILAGIWVRNKGSGND